MGRKGNNRGRGRSGGGRGNQRRDYERTDRVGELLREIIAEELREIGDETTAFVTVTGVDVDRELTKAVVNLSTLNLEDSDIEGVLEHAGRLRRAVGRQARIRRTPELFFQVDPGLRSGERVDEILRNLGEEE